MMLYNGVELPALSMLDTYSFVFIEDDGNGIYNAYCSASPLYLKLDSSSEDLVLYKEHPCAYYYTDLTSSEWRIGPTNDNWGGTFIKYINPLWSNHDIVNSVDGSIYFDGTTISIDSIQTLDDSVSAVYFVEGLGSTDAIYTLKGSLIQNGVEVRSIITESFSGLTASFHNTLYNLTPETAYTLTLTLFENGMETAVTASRTFTTVASATPDEPVDDTQTLSLLSAILAAIRSQAATQEQDNLTIISWLEMSWIRLRYIEQNSVDILAVLESFAPSKEETALKEAAKETTQAVVDEVFADDSSTKVTASDIGDMADSGKEVVNAFDTGTTVGDFFSVFTDYVFTGWFSEETRANLDTVNSVSTFGLDDDPYNHDSYNKNMEALDKFLERSGKVND